MNKRKQLIVCCNDLRSEAASVKSALLSLYAALPIGSLIQSHDEITLNDHLSYAVAETSGWNNALDELWRAYVLTSSSPIALMECCIMLEYYLNNKWLLAPYSRLQSALPAAHGALRSATYSSVALRVYSLDRALLYDKVELPKKDKRNKSSEKSKKDKDERDSIYQSSIPEPPKPRQSRVSLAAEAGVGRDGNIEGGSSSSRSSGRESSRKHYKEYPSDYDDDDAPSKQPKKKTKAEFEDEYRGPTAEDWSCTECSLANTARSRSCEACGAKKPSASGYQKPTPKSRKKTPSSSAKKRGRRSVKYNSDDEDDDEEDDLPITLPDLDAYESELRGDKETIALGKKMLSVLKAMKEEPDSIHFWEPVDSDSVPNYDKYVSDPIDLGTIATRVKSTYYGTDIDSFKSDINRVWDNCIAYNTSTSPIGKAAQVLKQQCEEILALDDDDAEEE